MPIPHRPGTAVARVAVLASLLAGFSGGSRADGQDRATGSPEALAFFEAKVRPVLVEHCLKCHDAGKQQSGLRLDSRAAILEGGDEGPAVVPGEPDKSSMILAVRHQGDHKMPPKGKLPDSTADVLAEWVRLGAPWPADVAPTSAASKADAAKGHWAYRPVVDHAPPAVQDSAWVASPVDGFVLAKLEAKHLAPSPRADRRTLIRRASYDLTGLPPTPEEVAAFVADDSSGAFARVVDRLLASPRYGERWGRHWLDVARYADSKGYVFTENRFYPYSYTYRDYVINAFNEDRPYDQFLVEQIAADRLPPGEDTRPLAALGFLTVGRRFLNDQNEIIDDRIDVVTRGLMGMTVTCARCHDHKFDPIPTEDYYSLHGVFASTVEPGDLPRLPGSVPEKDKGDYDRERRARLDKVEQSRRASQVAIEAELRDHLGAFVQAAFLINFDPKSGQAEAIAGNFKLSVPRVRFAARRLGKLLKKGGDVRDPILGPYRAFAALATGDFEPKAAAELARDLGPGIHPAVLEIFAGDAPKSLGEVAMRYGSLFERVERAFAPGPEGGPPPSTPDPALEAIHDRLHGPEDSPVDVPPESVDRILDRGERDKLNALIKKVDELDATHPGTPPRAMVLNDAPNPTNPHVFVRGNPGRPGKEVPRRFLKVLSPGGEAKPFADGGGRLDLARAIASPDNPLTARVMVNRIWHHHFGVGLVATPSDFGTRGDPPTHPELLDFLARRFVESGWSVKAVHRLILLSSTYQQASDRRPDAAEVDPANQLLHRQNRRRLDFEATRDGILAVAGKLDPSQGGRPIELFKTDHLSNRRTVYGLVDRYDLDPTYRTFDFASPDISNPKRPSTTVPQQALFLLNSPFLLEQAKALAHRPELASLPDLDAKISRLHLDLFGRAAEPREVDLARRFVNHRPKAENADAPSPWEEYAQVLLMTNEFSFLD